MLGPRPRSTLGATRAIRLQKDEAFMAVDSGSICSFELRVDYRLHMHSLTREFERFPDIVWQNLDQLYQMSRIVSYVGCKERTRS
jgi:hypothetical protein